MNTIVLFYSRLSFVDLINFINHLYPPNLVSLYVSVCKVSEPENAIHYSSPYSCRQVCSMSSQTERGCVMVRSQVYILSMFYLFPWMKIEMHLENIPTTTYCNYTGDLSRTEYFK